jgi:hypothetical protein
MDKPAERPKRRRWAIGMAVTALDALILIKIVI